MLQSYIDTRVVVVFCFIQWSACSEAETTDVKRTDNSREYADIIENFTELVDRPWDFFNKEDLKLLPLPNLAYHLCDLDLWCIFQCNFSLMDDLIEINRFQRAAMHELIQYYSSGSLQDIENATELQRYATLLLEKLIPEIKNMSTQHISKNESICSQRFLDLNKLESQLAQYNNAYNDFKYELLITQTRISILLYYFPPFLVVWFICGMIGNGLLLFIFVRHSDTRSGPNALLINLAVSDTVFLIISLTIEHIRGYWDIPFTKYGCYIYNFLLTCITADSVYSMTALSFLRYMAVTTKIGNKPTETLLSMPTVLLMVWILSMLVAVPDMLYTDYSVQESGGTFFCSMIIDLPNTISNFLLISFLPLILITFFYISASKRIQESICSMPGESMGHENIKVARKKVVKIFPVQAFVFAITYLPYYAFWVLEISVSLNSMASLVLYHTVYLLFNLNSTLNPIALYLVSSRFRNYFQKYLSLGFTKKQTSAKNLSESSMLPSGI